MGTAITVGQVLKSKGYGYHGIGPDAAAYDGLELMEEKNVGALLVVENGKLIGVFSERDYARKVVLKGKSSKNTTVRELMSGPPISVKPETSLRECMVLMTNFSQLPNKVVTRESALFPPGERESIYFSSSRVPHAGRS